MRNLLIKLLVFLLPVVANDRALGQTVKSHENTTSIAIPKLVAKPFDEAVAYRLLYENARDSNDRMMSTLQWVIGISVAFLLAILGSQIFFNWRINKKDIDYIKKDIDEKIAELKIKLLDDMDARFGELQLTIKQTTDRTENDLKNLIKEQNDKYSELYKAREKALEKELEFSQKEINREIKGIRIDLKKAEGDIWQLKGVEANAMSSYITTALNKLDLGQEVKYVLDDVILCLSKVEEIHEVDEKKLNELQEKLPAKYEKVKLKISELYKDKPVYKFQDSPLANSLLGRIGRSRLKYIKNIKTDEGGFPKE